MALSLLVMYVHTSSFFPPLTPFFFLALSHWVVPETHTQVEQCEHMGHPFAYSFLLLAA